MLECLHHRQLLYLKDMQDNRSKTNNECNIINIVEQSDISTRSKKILQPMKRKEVKQTTIKTNEKLF